MLSKKELTLKCSITLTFLELPKCSLDAINLAKFDEGLFLGPILDLLIFVNDSPNGAGCDWGVGWGIGCIWGTGNPAEVDTSEFTSLTLRVFWLSWTRVVGASISAPTT